MTIIVGFVDRAARRMYMYGDTQGTDGAFNSRIREDDKVFRKGDMLFGFTWSYRMGQLLKYKLEIPKHPGDMTTEHYLHTLFIDSIIKCFEKNGFQKKSDEVKEGGEFLVAYRGNIYKVCSDYQIELAVEAFTTCGCGEAYALGAIHILQETKEDMYPGDKCKAAIATAMRYSAGCGGHITNVEMEY